MLTSASLIQLRDVSIVDVIGRYVQGLKKNGSKYIACCPFHNEKSPSFNVTPAKSMYKCFGCGEGGDAIQFLRRHEKLDFREAAEIIAEIGGITLEYEQDFNAKAYEQKKAERKSLQQLIDECAARYTAQLWQDGSAGMSYLQSRGYDKSTISYWRLGYAPAESNNLVRHYFSSGSLPQLAKLSLITEKGKGEDARYYDFFQDRVLFPIINERGEIVSFGGRTLGDAKPKYLNTANTELYDKSRTLYGLYQAAKSIKELKFATLTEGYTDVIGLHRAGLTNAVATCGTALTPEQCALLKRHTDRVLLMRDGDDAGQKATSRDIALLVRHGLAVDVMPMELGEDPDDFAKQFISVKK